MVLPFGIPGALDNDALSADAIQEGLRHAAAGGAGSAWCRGLRLELVRNQSKLRGLEVAEVAHEVVVIQRPLQEVAAAHSLGALRAPNVVLEVAFQDVLYHSPEGHLAELLAPTVAAAGVVVGVEALEWLPHHDHEAQPPGDRAVPLRDEPGHRRVAGVPRRAVDGHVAHVLVASGEVDHHVRPPEAGGAVEVVALLPVPQVEVIVLGGGSLAGVVLADDVPRPHHAGATPQLHAEAIGAGLERPYH
mmetsp:Transcript_21712/g.60968  ORF Transcript_21712/g.60968 Transcript_21712/m.60968 type:complete len:247 (+) Transcript_21712:544-1284(+)